ncbi:MAG: phosphoribosylanthranilate isomerase, partial [Chthoniobacterales bacterium]
MSKPQIKVCGLTNTVDAHLCAALGVDMLGLNFSPQSLRCLDVKEAREIVSVVRADFPQVKLIGLFVDQPLDLVQGTISDLLLDGVQLHGNETPEFVHSVQA